MAKIVIDTANYFANAIIDLLDDNGYDGNAYGESGFILVNTKKKTYKDATSAGDRQALNPTTDWAAIADTVTSGSGGAQAPAAPSAVDTNGIRVGDVVKAVNTSKTKATFWLDTNRFYTVANITARGNINVGGEHDYLPSRFTVVTSSGNRAEYNAGVEGTGSAITTPVVTVEAVDIAGNVLRVGDTVLVKQPDGKKPVFRLRPNGVAVITRITAKGALGFDFDAENTFLSRRFQKVTLVPVTTGGLAEDNYISLNTGDLVVARPGRHSRNAENAAKFALPENTALEFLGATSSIKVILRGYNEHQYAVARFSQVVPA